MEREDADPALCLYGSSGCRYGHSFCFNIIHISVWTKFMCCFNCFERNEMAGYSLSIRDALITALFQPFQLSYKFCSQKYSNSHCTRRFPRPSLFPFRVNFDGLHKQSESSTIFTVANLIFPWIYLMKRLGLNGCEGGYLRRKIVVPRKLLHNGRFLFDPRKGLHKKLNRTVVWTSLICSSINWPYFMALFTELCESWTGPQKIGNGRKIRGCSLKTEFRLNQKWERQTMYNKTVAELLFFLVMQEYRYIIKL